MLIVGIKDIKREQWRKLLEVSPTASWFQSPEAYDFYISIPQIMTAFVVAVTRDTSSQTSSKNSESCTQRGNDISEDLKGVCVGYITRDKSPVKQFFTRRAIIYGGPLLSDDITDEELRELLIAVSRQPSISSRQLFEVSTPIYIETRNFSDFSHWRNVFEECCFSFLPHYDMFIDCSDRDIMRSKIYDGKMRQIRKAEAEGVEIFEATTEEEINEFYSLLKRLYKKKVRTPLFDLEFFTTFVSQKRGVLLLVKKPSAISDKQSIIIGGMLCPILNGKIIYEWYVVGPAIVTWAAMDYANRHNIPIFDLMGAGEPDVPYGVRDFKLQFGGELKEYGRFLKINNKLWYSIGKLGVKCYKRIKL